MVNIVPGYCVFCRSRCGTLNEIINDHLVNVQPDPNHPNGKAMCMKGRAAPELIDNPDRILYPMKRTRPKGDDNPGWQRISWAEALSTISKKLQCFKEETGAESVAFNVSTPSGTSLSDAIEWVERFIRIYGSPNTNYGTEICNWHKDVAHRWTFGCGIPVADYANADLMILWGHNPANTWLAQANNISIGRENGAKLIVVDPRPTSLAKEAECWLKVNPGTDGALALGLSYLLVKQNLFDLEFVLNWTNGPLLVRGDNGLFLREQDINRNSKANRYVVWNTKKQQIDYIETEFRKEKKQTQFSALDGSYSIQLSDGTYVDCKTAFYLYQELLSHYQPESVSEITGIPISSLETAAHLIATSKKIAYHSWSGVAQHTNATQTERAIASLYALTGCFDQIGCNRIYSNQPINIVNNTSLMSKSQWDKALGLKERPIGPPSQGWVHSQDIWRAILEEKPYKIRGMIGFGANSLLSQSDVSLGQHALKNLEFFVNIDLFETPTAKYADILLPTNTSWEREGLRVGFETSVAAQDHIQLRPRMVSARGESRSDLEIIFDLACRLGMQAQFFDGNIDKAWNYMLEPTGITVDMLRNKPEGIHVPLKHPIKKYQLKSPNTDYLMGFNTDTRLVELYSEFLLRNNYEPLPVYEEPKEYQRDDSQYPLRLTSVKNGYFCHSQHRDITSLRKRAPYPIVEISASLATDRNIQAGDWGEIKTRVGSARFKVKIEEAISHDTIIAEFGWWQDCPDFGKPSYPINSKEGSNYNSLISGDSYDPISGSLPLRSFRCQIKQLDEPETMGHSWNGQKDFKVIATHKENDYVTSVTFQSVDKDRVPNYEPGQHITITCCPILDSKEEVSRAYSLIGPAYINNRTTYSISVRHQKSIDKNGLSFQGIMSSYINTILKVGDIVGFTIPNGNFIVPLNAVRPVVIFAGGIGITPFISFLESLNSFKDRPEIVLYYANQNSQTHAFKNKLKTFEKNIDRLTIVNIYSHPLDQDILGQDYIKKGYITHNDIPRYLIEKNARYYLCGPQSMMLSISQGLREIGVPAFAIFYEKFSSPTKIDQNPRLKYQVIFQKSGVKSSWTTKDGTLLNFGKKLKVSMPSGCCVGQCGSCAIKILKGKVMHLNDVEPPEDGYCLTCQSIPIEDIILDI